jgi:hypothetical protein
MANYAVDSAATGANDGTSWADAFTTLAAAVAASTTADTIYVAPGHDEATTGTLVFPTTPGLRVLGAANTSAFPPTSLVSTPTALWGGGTGTASPGALAGNVYIFGLHIRSGTLSNAGNNLQIGSAATSTTQRIHLEKCIIEYRGPNSAARILLGPGGTSNAENNTIELEDTEIRFTSGSAVSIRWGAAMHRWRGVSITGTTFTDPPILLIVASNVDAEVTCCDFSANSFTSLVNTTGLGNIRLNMTGCKVPATFTLGSGAWNDSSGGSVLRMADCSSGDNHGLMRYETPQGSAVSDTTVKVTAGGAGQSWKITTESNVSMSHPFYSPWINLYHTGTSAISPYLEILRNDDSTTAYDNDEVWIEVLAKTTSGSTLATFYSDGMALQATPAAQDNSTLGIADWEGESGSYWFGKVVAPSLTPAENGHIMARVGVGINIVGKLYVDPQIRT